MINHSMIKLRDFEEKLTPAWSAYNVIGQVLNTKVVKSKSTSKEYQVLTFSDGTGHKVFMNCSGKHLQLNQKYNVRIKASKKDAYNFTVFVQSFQKHDSSTENYMTQLKSDSSWFNQVSTINLTVYEVKAAPVSNYPQVSDVDEFQPKSFLVKLGDQSPHTFFYRVWPNEEQMDVDQIVEGSVWKFSNVSLTKQKEGSVNIRKTPFSSIELVN